jgi:hypothetical protein
MALVRIGILGSPRPMPARMLPVVAGTAVVAIALPIFLVSGFPMSGWGLAAVLWAASQGLAWLIARLNIGVDTIGSSGVAAFGRIFRVTAVMVVIVVVAAADSDVGIAAAVVFALAYTLELGLSLISYYTGAPTR